MESPGDLWIRDNIVYVVEQGPGTGVSVWTLDGELITRWRAQRRRGRARRHRRTRHLRGLAGQRLCNRNRAGQPRIQIRPRIAARQSGEASEMQAGATLRRAGNALINSLMPSRCAGCGIEGAFLCDDCRHRLARLRRPYCLVCAAYGAPQLCENCAQAAPAFGRRPRPLRTPRRRPARWSPTSNTAASDQPPPIWRACSPTTSAATPIPPTQ